MRHRTQFVVSMFRVHRQAPVGACLIQKDQTMTKPDQLKPVPTPALLVFGKPTSPDLPQASWFRAENRQAVTSAAQALQFSVIDIKSDAERALIVGVHEGVLKGSGRMIVGSVTSEAYRRIEEYARKASGGDASPRAPAAPTIVEKPVSEQTMNLAKTGSATSAPAPKDTEAAAPDNKPVTAASPPAKPEKSATAPDLWDALQVGSHVVAKHWEADGEPYGWWIGKVTAIDSKDFVIVWLDYPSKTRPFRIDRKNVAILHPSFELKTEWERKRR
jgi:hypothetical protein